MAKFCGQCGAQLNDNATFCTNCGASIAPAQPAAQQTASPMANLQQAAKNINMNAIKDAVSVENIKNLKSKPNKLTIAVLGVLLALIIVLIIILCAIFGGGSYKTPLDNMMKVVNKGSASALEDLMPPYYKDVKKAMSDITGDDIDFKEEAQSVRENFQDTYGDDAKMSYKVTDKTKLDKDELKDYDTVSSLTSILSKSKAKKYKLTAGYELTVEFTLKADGDETSDETTIIVGKMDGEWVLLDAGDFDGIMDM